MFETRKIEIKDKPLRAIFNSPITKPNLSKVIEKLKQLKQPNLFANCLGKCAMCGSEVTADPPILPRGNFSPKVLFIGRNPGKRDSLQGDILEETTPVGKLFDKYLEELNISRSEAYVTNVCFCYTTRNYPLNTTHIVNCSAWKQAEFSLLDLPKHIVLMGNDALKLFYGLDSPSISAVFGDVYKSEWEGEVRYFYPILHPAFIYRNPEWSSSVDSYLKFMRNVIHVQDNN